MAKAVSIAAIVKRHTRPGAHPDEGRAQLHQLGPERMAEILALALTSTVPALDLLAITMADVVYPPALPHFRRWLDEGHFDLQVTAACALDAALSAGGDKPFDIVGKIGGPQGTLSTAMDALRIAWDAAPVTPEVDVWLIAAERKQAKDAQDVPPRARTLSVAEAAERQQRHIETAALCKRLPPLLAHRVDHALAGRLMPIWSAVFPDDDSLARSHAVVGAFLDGNGTRNDVFAQQPMVSGAIGRARDAADYSKRHRRWRNPEAAAAYHVGQCFHYLIDPSLSSRGVGCGFGFDAIVHAGLGGKACLAEVARYGDDVVAASAEVDAFLAFLNGRLDPACRDDDDAISWLRMYGLFPLDDAARVLDGVISMQGPSQRVRVYLNAIREAAWKKQPPR